MQATTPISNNRCQKCTQFVQNKVLPKAKKALITSIKVIGFAVIFFVTAALFCVLPPASVAVSVLAIALGMVMPDIVYAGFELLKKPSVLTASIIVGVLGAVFMPHVCYFVITAIWMGGVGAYASTKFQNWYDNR